VGSEVVTRVEIGAEAAEAKALLETEEVIVRGAIKARIPFSEAKDVAADGGVLRLRWNDRDVRIHVGKDAPKWAEKIRNPKSVLDKLGVKAGQRVSVVGTVDDSFLAELEERGTDLSRRRAGTATSSSSPPPGARTSPAWTSSAGPSFPPARSG
jgi:hypothetical protein